MSKEPEKPYPAQVHRGVSDVELKNKKSDINKLFLYNKDIDALIYTYFLEKSCPVKNDNGQMQTRVWKTQIPNQDEIAKICRISKSTYCRKLKILKENQFILDYPEYYLIKKKPESSYLQLPLDTIKFFLDTYNSNTIKTYIYLAQGYKFAVLENGRSYYTFTKQEIMKVIKISTTHKQSQEQMTHILDNLVNNGLIELGTDKFEGKRRLKTLKKVNWTYIKNDQCQL